MNIEEFKIFVSKNEKWFEGVNPETSEQLSYYEKQLGFLLPESLKWLLSSHGYSSPCGIDNLEESIKKTLELRESIKLLNDILVINDWGDAGLVFSIGNDPSKSEHEIIWANTADIYNLIEGKPLPKEADHFKNYPLWVFERLEDEKEESEY